MWGREGKRVIHRKRGKNQRSQGRIVGTKAIKQPVGDILKSSYKTLCQTFGSFWRHHLR